MSGSNSRQRRTVRIGGASAFWGDSATGPVQLVERGEVDYLVFDYLAETTMAVLAAARLKDPQAGYATDFVAVAMRSVLPRIAQRGIKVLANAGGINLDSCRSALLRLAYELGLKLSVAVVGGDDVKARLSSLQPLLLDGETPASLPADILSANAYLGAFPLARALDEGADIVITGRCVDSALTLAPLIHEFGWRSDEYDRLAAGSLAGHIIECGCQAAGGLFTDWERVPGWAEAGYPVLECDADGDCVVTKPPDTGGLIDVLAVTEQLLYEIGDPAAYILPDVVCDFADVTIVEDSPGRVRVSGARGRKPTDHYKVSITSREGWRCSGSVIIIGTDAVRKARRTGHAILARARHLLTATGFADFDRTLVEVIGAEASYGPHSRASAAREVMVRVTVTHADRRALDLFAREIAPSGTSWAPGTTMPAGGRPSASPLIRQLGVLVPKAGVTPFVSIGERQLPIEVAPGESTIVNEGPGDCDGLPEPAQGVEVPLLSIACARSGDKGDRSNIGVIARRSEYLPLILAQVTPAAVARYFAHLVTGPVKRFVLRGVPAVNFVLDAALDGGGTASLRMDPLGKGMAQMLLDMPVRLPVSADIPVDSIADLIRQRAVELGDQLAFIAPSRRWTYRDLDAQSNRIARGLAAAGVGSGDAIACLTKHAAECALLLMAASKLGAALAPLNWRLSGPELRHVVGVVKPKVLVADAFLSETLAAVPLPSTSLRLVTDGEDESGLEKWALLQAADDPAVRPTGQDVAVLLFSSGTSGFPKAIKLSHAGILCQCSGWASTFGYGNTTVHLNVLPTFHVSGIVNALWMIVVRGIAVFQPEFEPARFIDAIARDRVTDVFVVPAMLRALLLSPEIATADLFSLRSIAYGGSPIDPTLMVECLRVFPCGFQQVYGMTEASGVLTTLVPEEHKRYGPRPELLTSVGRPAKHIELRVMRPGGGLECADEELGEVYVRSPQLMCGYFEDEAATAAAFPGGRSPAGGWMRTGDVGFLREGYLYLRDRLKDMIISGGENVYPVEVERVLSTHPDILEVAVIGVPDVRWGETVKACVVQRVGADVTAADLIQYARDRIAHYKCPTSVDFVAQLPRNPGGKILKRLLREPYWAGRDRNIS